jgi:hypothetical protein
VTLLNARSRGCEPLCRVTNCITLAIDLSARHNARAQKQVFNWQSKKLSATLDYPWLSDFKYHVQLLLLDIIKAVAESLNEEARDRLLKRWEQEVGKFARALIGPSVTEWLNREAPSRALSAMIRALYKQLINLPLS